MKDYTELRGNWADDPCFYVNCRDAAGHSAVLLGPFHTESVCDSWATGGNLEMIITICEAFDKDARTYTYEKAKRANGYREGLLNSRLPEAEQDFNRH